MCNSSVPDPSRREFLQAGGQAIAALLVPSELLATTGGRGDLNATSAGRFPYFQSEPVSYLHVRMQDTFWAPRQKITHAVSVPWVTQAHDRSGGLTQFKKESDTYVAQTQLGSTEHVKFIEAMAAVIGVQRDPAVVGMIDAWAKPLIEKQGADGYLAEHFPRAENHPSQRWMPVWWSHEDYHIGHYLESAIAYREVTGSEDLYRSAVRAVDNMASALLGSQRAYTSGHPEIEQALMSLYGVTGEKKYLSLCGWLLDQRGRHAARPSFGRYGQDHVPIKEQRTIEGHAVRAAFLFNGVTQYVGATGDQDYRNTVLAVWEDLVGRKMYLHGATGNLSARNEGYRRNSYCILPDDAYGESCAVIANFQWAHSLFRLTAEARYLDTAERLLYNAFAAALSLRGDSAFYCNVAQSDPKDEIPKIAYPHTRSSQLAAGCCPPNIVKLVNKVSGFFYSVASDGIYVNHYGACEALVPWRSGIRITQHTAYPWGGEITLRVRSTRPEHFTLRLRLPDWAKSYQLAINGRPVETAPRNGWLPVQRLWNADDRVELTFPMSIERVTMGPEFREYENRVALRRGPIVYCLEGEDAGKSLRDSLAAVYMPQQSIVTAEHRPEFLGGVTVLKGEVREVVGHFEYDSERVHPAEFVPYAVWGNRAPGAMRVWLGASRSSVVDFTTPQPASGESCVS